MYATEENTSQSDCSISLCICTMNRPEDLRKCLESVFQGKVKPDEVIVSDDSPDPTATKAVVERYPAVTYQTGPRLGLGPNRNACIRRVQSTHLMFIDDDVCVPPDCFEIAYELIAQTPESVITGYEMKHRSWEGEGTVKKILPHNADFWGTMKIPVGDSDCRSVVMNSTIFPVSLFKEALFDECLRYGYEELDIARHAVALGYEIVHRDNLWVNHYQSLVDRASNWDRVLASQLYTTAKAYFFYEKSIPKALTYTLIAPLKMTAGLVKQKDPKAIQKGVKATVSAYQHFFSRKEKGFVSKRKSYPLAKASR